MNAERLRQLVIEHRIATTPELKDALGSEVDQTVFRKLRELGYHSSYYHRGKYYTLNEIVRFDERGRSGTLAPGSLLWGRSQCGPGCVRGSHRSLLLVARR